jgi:hypothetical protein
MKMKEVTNMKAITRTIPTSKIYATIVEVEIGKIVNTDLSCIEVVGEEITETQAKKIVAERFETTGAFLIREIEIEKTVYELELDKFIQYAKVVEPKSDVPEVPVPPENLQSAD